MYSKLAPATATLSITNTSLQSTTIYAKNKQFRTIIDKNNRFLFK